MLVNGTQLNFQEQEKYHVLQYFQAMCWPFQNVSFYFQNAKIFILAESHVTQSFSSISLGDILPTYAYYHHSN